MVNLKPCPFCGDSENVKKRYMFAEHGIVTLIQCFHCGAQYTKIDAGVCEEDVINGWNRRVNEARLLTLDEALTASGIVWCEFNDGQSTFIRPIDLYIGDDGETAEAEVVGRAELALLNYRDYGGTWRAWSAEPSKELRESTPWEQKQR